MRRIQIAVLAGCLMMSTSLVASDLMVEAISDHHEHPGLTDAGPDAGDHRHGDSDDHHDSPQSPCHHHIAHCGCAHPILTATETGLAQIPEVARGFLLALATPPSEFALSSTFHIPIA